MLPSEASCISHPYSNEDYTTLGEQLWRAAGRIKNKLVDSTIDCKATALCCAIMSTMYRFLSAVSRMVLFGVSTRDARRSAALESPKRLPTSQEITVVRTKLIQTMVSHGKMLSHKTRINGKESCPLDNLVALILMSDCTAFYSDPAKVSALEGYVAEDNDWVVDNNLAIDTRIRLADGSLHEETTPVLSYRMSQLLGALKQVSNYWRTVCFDDQLGLLVDLLRVRAGIFVLSSFDNVVHDMPELCEGGFTDDNPKGEYQANSVFLGTVTDLFSDMIRDLVCFSGFPRLPDVQVTASGACCGDLNEWLKLKECVVAWIERKLSSMVATSGSTYVSKYVIALDMRPGERNAYAREFTQRLADDSSVLQTYRSINFDALCQLRKRTYIDILTEDFVKPFRVMQQDKRPRSSEKDWFAPEPPQVYLGFMEMLESHMIATYFGLQWRDFWIMEPDLEKRRSDLDASKWPIMVQAFNHWHLYYSNGLIRMDSFIKCFIAFLRVIERDFRGKLHSWDIMPWITEITTEGGKNPTNASMFSFSSRRLAAAASAASSSSKKNKKKRGKNRERDEIDTLDAGLLSVV